MKIQQHPRMRNILIGDEVYNHPRRLYAQVADVFPSAVCVKVGILRDAQDLIMHPQLWRADEIENLSVCRFCGSREEVQMEYEDGIPFRICDGCRQMIPPSNGPIPSPQS
ncbi:MAG: hypothetical protein HC837_06240 [Chloroflexaceae bacterium]|nr:hypothetical protein [Chloroflexaceae bacterium]